MHAQRASRDRCSTRRTPVVPSLNDQNIRCSVHSLVRSIFGPRPGLCLDTKNWERHDPSSRQSVASLLPTMDTPTVTLRTFNGWLALHISRMLLLNGETQRD